MRHSILLVSLLTLFCGAWSALAQDADRQSLPRWLRFSFQERGRFEEFTGLGYVEGNNDGYFLNRLRFEVELQPAQWLRFHLQAQDARAPGHREPVPSNSQDPIDVRLAYLDLGRLDGSGWSVRAGRQSISYGDQRLIGGAEWANVPRSWDAALLTWRNPSMRFEWFLGTLAVPDSDSFDRFRDDDRVAGFHATFQRDPEGRSIEPYLFWTATRNELSETGTVGGKHVYTIGTRLHGPLPHHFDYTAEAALQLGDQARDSLRAFATALALGHTFSRGLPGVRLYTEYDYASGDDDPGDGRIGTFDNLYPTNHGIYGIVDRQGWRNMHGIRVGGQKPLTRWWRVQLDYHSFWLANRNDFLYWANGAPIVRNPDASSRHAGQEFDFQNMLNLHRALSLHIGVGHMFPGGFLKESTTGSPVTFAYAQFQLTLAPD